MILPPVPVTYSAVGWAGYGWASSSKAEAQFRVPSVNGADRNSSMAVWAGIGDGNPGIQQAGITVAVDSSKVIHCNAWYEMWPAAGHSYGGACAVGDVIHVSVTRSGSKYTLTVKDDTRHWSATAVKTYAHTEPDAEAVAEDFGPPVPQFAHLEITTSGTDSYAYSIDSAYPVKVSGNAFDVLWK